MRCLFRFVAMAIPRRKLRDLLNGFEAEMIRLFGGFGPPYERAGLGNGWMMLAI